MSVQPEQFDGEDLEDFNKEFLKSKTQKENPNSKEFKDFEMMMVIGRGSFGKVYVAELKENKKLYAVKAVKKHEVIKNGMESLVDQELDIMLEMNHPFLVSLHYVF